MLTALIEMPLLISLWYFFCCLSPSPPLPFPLFLVVGCLVWNQAPHSSSTPTTKQPSFFPLFYNNSPIGIRSWSQSKTGDRNHATFKSFLIIFVTDTVCVNLFCQRSLRDQPVIIQISPRDHPEITQRSITPRPLNFGLPPEIHICQLFES